MTDLGDIEQAEDTTAATAADGEGATRPEAEPGAPADELAAAPSGDVTADRAATTEEAPADAVSGDTAAAEEARADAAGSGTSSAAPPTPAPAAEDEIPDVVREAMAAAQAAEGQGVDKGIDAWRKLVQANPTLRAPRLELARLYRAAERWNALAELLKEQAEKLPQLSTDEKVATLLELVGIYRDRLKLDMMVVSTYNAILALDPGHREVLDALATQYENMKRWPDLINVLNKKAAQSLDAGEQIEIYTRIATLFQERFSNAAEAIKAYEKVLELDPQNEAAILFLKMNYEKRRDWEKLIAVHQREIERLADPVERSARFVEVAKLASERLKKPSVSIELWAKVLDGEPYHQEALSELEKLYEREKRWDELADVCERQVETTTDVTKKVGLLQKLGILFTDKVNEPARATRAWQKLLELEPDNKRAQDSLKKLYLSEKAWGDLEKFYAAQGKIDEYIRVLERQVESEDASTKITLNLRIAELYRDELQKPDRAMRAFEKVLTLDGEHAPAAEALIPLYEAAKDYKHLAEVLEIQLGHTTDRPLRLDRIRGLLQISETHLRDKAAAYGWALKAFAEERASRGSVDSWTRDEAERLARETAGWPELVTAYELAYNAFDSPVDALPLMATVARVYEEELGDTEAALQTNQRILVLDDANAQAIAALERLYVKSQQYSELLKIYERKLQLESDESAQKEIRYRIASLFEEELDDPKQAVAAYTAIVDEVGDELQALRALDRIYVQTKGWAELGEIIPRELAALPVDDTAGQVELKFRLGEMREDHLSDTAGAIECYRDVLDLAPEHEGAQQRLERHLSEPDHQLVVAGLLEPIYSRLEAWQRLVEVHEIQLARETDGPSRVNLLLRIGELWAQSIGDPSKAFDAYSRAFREDPASQTAAAELLTIATVEDRFADLVSLYEAALAPEAPPLGSGLTRELLLKVAELYDDKLQRSDKAIENYRRVLSQEPDDTEALEALERLYTRQEQWADLLDVYRRKVDLTDDREAREGLYFRIAYLWEEAIGNVDEAVATYKEVLSQDDANVKALRALDRLYQVKKAWHELADNLQRQLSLTSDAQDTIGLQVRLAALREHELGEVAAAVDTYRQVLDLDAENEPAREALERLLGQPEHELQVATLLEPIYRTHNEWSRLVGVYEIMVRHALDPARKIELLHQIGELYEVGGDDADSAFHVYHRALREDPSLKETQTRLERLAQGLSRWSELVDLYREVAADQLDQQLQVQLWTRVAQIYETELQNDEEAGKAYQRVLSADSTNLQAADALQEIYFRTEAYQQLVDVILRKVDMVDDIDDKKDLCFRAARIREEVLEQPDQAIQIYQLVLSFDENEPKAIDALERLYIRLQRWEPLKDVYRKKVELVSSVEDKKQIYFVLGRVYDHELRDIPAAIETYQAILDLDPEDVQAIQALDRLYGQAERWYDLLQILEREVELAQTTSETAALKHRIGQLWQLKLKDLARAVEAYREVLTIDPSHETTLQALDGIVHGDDEPVLAAQVLEPIFESSGEWPKLIDVYEVMVRHADSALRRVELLQRIAMLHEHRSERPDQAFEAYGRALREDSTNDDTLAHLERLAAETGAWERLVALYEEELGKLLDPTRQVEMLLRTARVYEEELGNADKAITTMRRVLEVDPEERTAILALDRLYQSTQRWPDLAEILRAEIRLAQTDEEIIGLLFRQGQLHESELGDLDQALGCYREILASDPAHGPTLAALELLFADDVKQLEIATILEPLYTASEQWEKLVRVHEVQLKRLDDSAERQGLLQRIAEICEQRLGDAFGAFEAWARALAEEPLGELAGEEVERLARAAGAWSEVVKVYDHILTSHDDVETQRRTLLKQARVWMVELEDAARAEEAYHRVLSLDPKDPDALLALDRLYEGSGMWNELSEILTRRIAVTTVTDEKIDLYFRLGHILDTRLELPERSVRAYNAVLDLETRNVQALQALEQVLLRLERWPELYGVYEKMVDIAQTDAEMAECYARMANLAGEALGQRERAIDLWTRVLDFRGEDQGALERLSSLYAQAQNWPEMVEVLERRIRSSGNPAEQVALYSQLAHVWTERLHDDQRALSAWQEALALDDQNLAALSAVEAIYERMEAWPDLAETLERHIEVGHGAALPDGELRGLYARLAALYGTTLQRPHDAITAWNRVLLLSEHDLEALGALETLYTEEARWEECIEVLERKAQALADAPSKVAVLSQAAELWKEKIDRLDHAALVYERVLEIDGHNLAASEQLEALYRELGRWEKLVELLLQRTELVDAPTRIALFQDMARIYESRLGDREGAFVVLQAAFKEDFSNNDTSRELERLATIDKKWAELLTDYTQVVRSIADPKVAASLWVKIGRWYGEHLGHLEYAIASEKQAIALDPAQEDGYTALADFYRRAGRWAELGDVLAHHAELAAEPSRRVELYLQLADLDEHELADREHAIAAYRRAVEVDPECRAALDALQRLYAEAGDAVSLIDTLERKAKAATSDSELIELRREIGRLYEEGLGKTDASIAAYKEVLTLNSRDSVALAALEKLYEKSGQLEAYLNILQDQLDVVTSDAERIVVFTKIAETWEARFRRPERAWEAYEQILAFDDRHEPTLRSLERLYTQERRFVELVDTLRRHINAVQDTSVRIELYGRMGEVYENELRDPDRAIEAYADILTFDSTHEGALLALGRLYEATSQWDRAIDAMNTLVELTGDTALRVNLYHRIGRILEEQIGEPDTAEARYAEALAIDPTYIPVMNSLVGMYQRRGDWFKAAQLMVRAEEHTPNPVEKVRLLYEAGRIYREKLDDEHRGGELFARVLELDPEHAEAGEPLADWYFRFAVTEPERTDIWQALEPILDMLVRKLEKRQGPETAQLYYRLATTAEHLGNVEKALKYYKLSYDLDPQHLPTLLGRAALLYQQQDWDGAFKIYQTILVNQNLRDSQSPAEIVDIFYRLGQIKLQQQEIKKALNMFEKALEIDPVHRPTLEAVIELQTAQGDFEAVVVAKRQIAQVADATERFALLDEVGDLCHSKLRSPPRAIEAYQEALQLRNDAHAVLHKLLELYYETKQWPKVIDVLRQFTELEQSPIIRGKYFEAAAKVMRDELGMPEQAVDAFDRSLDCYFERPDELQPAQLQTYLKPFLAIDKICTQAKDWKGEERAYRRMLKRMPGDGMEQIKIMLWENLGEIYRSRLRDFKAATQAFEVAVKLDPGNIQRHEILAELYIVAGPEHSQKAVAEHMALLRQNPLRFESYRALRKLYMEMREYDRAWCVCAALNFSQRADADEVAFYEQYRPKTLIRAKQRLTDELWQRCVFHVDEDRYIAAIYGVIWQAVALLPSRAFEHKRFGLKRKDKLDLAKHEALFSKVFTYVASVLGVSPLPEVYLRPDQQMGMQLVNCRERNQLIPSILVGAELLQGRTSDKELAFPIASFLTKLRPEHYLKSLLQTNTELRVAFLAALKLVQPNFPLSPMDQQILDQSQYIRELQATMSLNPAWLEQLALVVQQFFQAKAEVDLNRWSRAVELTAHRAAFVICNDLALAARSVQAEPTVAGGLQPKNKVNELLLYAISEPYFELRNALGITIG